MFLNPLNSLKMNVQTAVPPPKQSIRTLLSGIVDYAGLFPPSMLSMGEAVANFASYRAGNHAWMLGRFVVPVARLNEFLLAADEHFGGEPWRLSVLAGEDITTTIREIKIFNAENGSRALCDSIEVKATTVSKIENTVAALSEDLTAYFEISTGENFAELVTMLSLKGQRAKIRTGGTIREEFPASRDVIRFIRTCMAANVPFKATAGLHHPIRCYRPLTYAADAPKGTMHGFLNVLLMTGFARESFRVALLEELMEEEFDEAFAFRDNGIAWRNEHVLTEGHIQRLRKKGMISFGSCSFTEPVEDLQGLGLL
ncbi:MAG TPA: hypothetical protein PKD26_07575 [Pyrinomonadaceae bacterium]|nr:hypothetical protein [Pyrinomonadaceae bacterium]